MRNGIIRVKASLFFTHTQIKINLHFYRCHCEERSLRREDCLVTCARCARRMRRWRVRRRALRASRIGLRHGLRVRLRTSQCPSVVFTTRTTSSSRHLRWPFIAMMTTAKRLVDGLLPHRAWPWLPAPVGVRLPQRLARPWRGSGHADCHPDRRHARCPDRHHMECSGSRAV